MTRRISAMMQSILVFIRRDTARYRSNGSNGFNAHPKAGSSWPMAYPYSPMLPSVLAVVNVEGVHNRTTTAPRRSHTTPTALPQELHRCDLESPLLSHNRRRTHAPFKEDVNTSPPFFSREGDVPTSPPAFLVQQKRQTLLPQLATRLTSMSRP